MRRNYRLLFGPLAGIILAFGIVGLALLLPEYSQVHQTVSEIGETSSPARIPFAIMLGCVAVCILVFALGVRDASLAARHSPLAAYSIGFMAVSAAGIAVFAYPHPAHNIFGMSELIGYQAPLAFALAWRHDPRAKRLVVLSWIFFLLIWGAIVVNLSPFIAPVWVYVKPFHGLVQRALFAAWFGWCAIAGILLFKQSREFR